MKKMKCCGYDPWSLMFLLVNLLIRRQDSQHNKTQHKAKHCYAECHLCSVSFMLSVIYKPFAMSVIMLCVVMLNVVMLTAVMLCVIMLNVVMLTVVMLSAVNNYLVVHLVTHMYTCQCCPIPLITT
jgi:hypothetical protein